MQHKAATLGTRNNKMSPAAEENAAELPEVFSKLKSLLAARRIARKNLTPGAKVRPRRGTHRAVKTEL